MQSPSCYEAVKYFTLPSKPLGEKNIYYGLKRSVDGATRIAIGIRELKVYRGESIFIKDNDLI